MDYINQNMIINEGLTIQGKLKQQVGTEHESFYWKYQEDQGMPN